MPIRYLYPEPRGETVQRVTPQRRLNDLRKQPHVERSRPGKGNARALGFFRENSEVIADRMTHDHAAADEIAYGRPYLGKAGCVPHFFVVDAMHARRYRRNWNLRIDKFTQGLGFVQPPRRKPYRADLYNAGRARIEARGFGVERERVER